MVCKGQVKIYYMFGLNNVNDFFNFVVQNVLWFMITILIAAIISFGKAPIIARKLLKGNRGVIGNGLGKHFADRYIDIWYKRNLKYVKGCFYEGAANAMLSPNKSRYWQEVIDRELEKLKLINIRSNDRVEAIENLRNRIIIFIIQWYLIHFIGDDRNYYKTLKAERKRK